MHMDVSVSVYQRACMCVSLPNLCVCIVYACALIRMYAGIQSQQTTLTPYKMHLIESRALQVYRIWSMCLSNMPKTFSVCVNECERNDSLL